MPQISEAPGPAERVQTLRRRLNLDQEQFARKYGLRVRTVQEWEQRRAVPEGPARTLLDVIEREALAVERALLFEDGLYAATMANVRELVQARLPAAIWSERQQNYPAIWLDDRLVTVGLDFWPGSSRSCILVSAAEHHWFDIAESAIPIAEYVVNGLIGSMQPPEMTFARFVDAAHYAMHSVVNGRADVELETQGIGIAIWRSSKREVRLRQLNEYQLIAERFPAEDDRRQAWLLVVNYAAEFGARYLAETFIARRWR